MAAGSPPRKVDALLDAMAASDWPRAIRIAARWPRLGEHKAPIKAAAAALLSPNFYVSLGFDPQALINDGIAAIQARYGHMQTPKETVMAMKTQEVSVTPREWMLSKMVRDRADPRQAEALGRQLPAIRAEITGCDLAGADALRAKYLAMPRDTELQFYWRMQCLDALAVRVRRLKGKSVAEQTKSVSRRKQKSA